MSVAALIAALEATAKAAVAEREASRKASRAGTWGAYFESEERRTFDAAKVAQVGRVTVAANIAGNSRAAHVRHTFKVDGKRASRAQAEAAV